LLPWCRQCARYLRRRLLPAAGSPGAQPAIGEALTIRIRRSPQACWLTTVFLGLSVAFALQLLANGYWPLATLLLASTALAVPAALREVWLLGTPDRSLLLGARGQIALRASEVPLHQEAVELLVGSVFLGRGVLLVLRGEKRHRLWLDAGSVDPVKLAALQRWLRRNRTPSKVLG
jgi:hypothetical protein